MKTLTALVDALNSGTLKVVDLTQPLGPATPVIGLPPIFAASPGVTIDVISRYDDKGPAWYWNTLRFGEHTGTHFDAPIHWITGKDLPDNACDTIPARRFVGPACVIDVTRRRRGGRGFPADGGADRDVGARARTHSGRRVGPASHGLESPGGPGGLPERRGRRAAQPGVRRARVAAAGARSRRARRRRRDDRHGRRPGRDVRSAVSESHDHARRRQVRPGEPVQSRSAAGDRRRRHRGAAEDRARQRQPARG